MLTPQEQQELKLLEAEKMQAAQMAQQPQGLTPQEQQELAQLEAEKNQFMRQPQEPQDLSLSQALGQVSNAIVGDKKQDPVFEAASKNPEASLGPIVRGQYAIEPLESNRRALLAQEFGQENLFESPQGDVYLLQDGQLRPVNAPGISTADIADVAGALPEMVGAGAGALLGMGAASVPGAMVGGAVGSAARQGLSAALGTPQVADVGERVLETGLSAAMSGAGQFLGNKAKPIVKKGIKKFFPKLAIGGQGKRLLKIAKKEGIPSPTPGQVLGESARAEEKIVSQLPFVGHKVRKQIAAQEDAIARNLKNVAGDFFQESGSSKRFSFGENLKNLAESKKTESLEGLAKKKSLVVDDILDGIKGGNLTKNDTISAGDAVKNFALEKRAAIKKASSELFDEVANEGANVYVPANEFKSSFLDSIGSIGIFDRSGRALPFNAELGISRQEFTRLQRSLGPIIKGLRGKAMPSAGGKLVSGAEKKFLSANSLNAYRKTIQAEIREARSAGVSDKILNDIKRSYEDVIEEMLKSQDKLAAEKWKVARGLWRRQIQLGDIIERGGKGGLDLQNMPTENVAKNVFRDTNSTKLLEAATDTKTTKELANQFILDIVSDNTSDAGVLNSKRALRSIENRKAALKYAIGRKEYDKIVMGIKEVGRIEEMEKAQLKKFTSFGLDKTSREEVANKILNNTNSLIKFKNEFGEKEVKKAAKQYLFDLFQSKTSPDLIFAPRQAYKTLRDKADVIKMALGDAEYESLVNNLTYLDEIRFNPNPSGTFWTQLRADPLKALALAVKEGGKLKGRKMLSELPTAAQKTTRRLFQAAGQGKKREAGYKAREMKYSE